MQSKRRSALESAVMTGLGIGYAIPMNYVFINKMSWSSPYAQAFWITFWFTVISFVLKYVVRRMFNWWDIITELELNE